MSRSWFAVVVDTLKVGAFNRKETIVKQAILCLDGSELLRVRSTSFQSQSWSKVTAIHRQMGLIESPLEYTSHEWRVAVLEMSRVRLDARQRHVNRWCVKTHPTQNSTLVLWDVF